MGKGWKNPFKEAQAQKKGKLYTKVAREISVAAKMGGPDPDSNARLKMAIDAAKQVSCPKDTIERSIKRGSGQLEGGAEIEELTYEGLGPSGVGFIIECQTDNRNRTVSELRMAFRKNDGNLGESGSVMWMFDRVCLVVCNKDVVGDAEEDAIESGANEVEKTDDGDYLFWGAPTELDSIRTQLQERGWTVSMAELSYKAKNTTEVLDEEIRAGILSLTEALDDLDDSHRVYSSLADA